MRVGGVLQELGVIAHVQRDPTRALMFPMLILTRRAGETLRIGDDVEVTVMAVNGAQVRIGIKAPRDVVVDREEIAERKRREKDTATSHIPR